jgi:glycosyltransferase involved in cell wall biosynthesis
MRVLFFSAYNAISGGTIMLFEHAYRLQKKGFDVSITFRDVNPEISFDVFPHNSELNIIEYGDEMKFDIVIATYWTTVYDLSNFNAKHYVYFSQCDERLFYEIQDPTRFWVEQTYTLNRLPIIASAQFLAQRYETEFGADTHYLPYGMDLKKFNPSGRKKEDKIRVLIEGAGLAKIKRVADAFEVVKGIPNIEVWYVTYDGHIEPEWKANRVFRSVPYSEMPKIYRSCDILLKLSEVESFGLPNLEMMACGGAIITSNFTGHEEYARDGENAFVVKIGDVEAARKKLLELIVNRETLNQFKQEGLATANQRNWDTLTPDLNSVLQQILKNQLDGNAEECRNRLLSMHLAFYEQKEMSANLKYLQHWKNQIAKREKNFSYRVAAKLYGPLK